MGTILVAEEKHGTFYYPASTDEELSKSALKILTERHEQGYWYHDPEKDSNDMAKLLGKAWPGWDVTEDVRVKVINQFSADLKEKWADDAEVYALKSRSFKVALRDYKYDREHRSWYYEMKDLVESQDHTKTVTFKSGRTIPLSWHLLNERSDHEYERVELEDLQEID